MFQIREVVLFLVNIFVIAIKLYHDESFCFPNFYPFER